KGSPALAMGKSASGGELSRLMLALELSCAGERATDESDSDDGAVPAMTFIFDEIDAGVGGKAGVELGKRLARLARRAQVIVVTHLPQVASWADSQFVVGKSKDDDGTVSTHVREVIGDARTEEIARMLDGSTTPTSLEHAKELLAASKLT
ncbi:MAG: DNA repair protein RecN, partial [Bifidobacterium choerinum]